MLAVGRELEPGQRQPSWLGIGRIRLRCDPSASGHGPRMLYAVVSAGNLAGLDSRGTAQVVEKIMVPDHDGERLVVVDMRGRPGVQGRDGAARDQGYQAIRAAG